MRHQVHRLHEAQPLAERPAETAATAAGRGTRSDSSDRAPRHRASSAFMSSSVSATPWFIGQKVDARRVRRRSGRRAPRRTARTACSRVAQLARALEAVHPLAERAALVEVVLRERPHLDTVDGRAARLAARDGARAPSRRSRATRRGRASACGSRPGAGGCPARPAPRSITASISLPADAGVLAARDRP